MKHAPNSCISQRVLQFHELNGLLDLCSAQRRQFLGRVAILCHRLNVLGLIICTPRFCRGIDRIFLLILGGVLHIAVGLTCFEARSVIFL